MTKTAQALSTIKTRIENARKRNNIQHDVRLVAVSKTKPASLIQDCYDAGHRHFGENYAQELIDKAKELPQDISWHFIGHLQSNKAKRLIEGVPNLFMVQTIDRIKIANALNKAVEGFNRDALRVLVQVNTSQEESKSGVPEDNVVDVVRHILENCSHLKFCGLMTIGRIGDSSDFMRLSQVRDQICRELKIEADQIELSMGMSGDFEEAIASGSHSVRVGSSIFGAREYKNKQN
eukprot:gb/GECH01009563.1/.p1 GENE.gb/GECH01009563.1/~~gb/GECH01009563.1/.p1  ORF type:complete len:235 (+),score=52.64 gb/GECH01009563.1/:1-705(+)